MYTCGLGLKLSGKKGTVCIVSHMYVVSQYDVGEKLQHREALMDSRDVFLTRRKL